jgi:hypothetical protein
MSLRKKSKNNNNKNYVAGSKEKRRKEDTKKKEKKKKAYMSNEWIQLIQMPNDDVVHCLDHSLQFLVRGFVLNVGRLQIIFRSKKMLT